MLYVLELFVFNYLMIILIRGVNRYNAINRYQHDYYRNKSMTSFKKLVHNCFESTLSFVTLGIVVTLTLIEYYLLDRYTFII